MSKDPRFIIARLSSAYLSQVMICPCFVSFLITDLSRQPINKLATRGARREPILEYPKYLLDQKMKFFLNNKRPEKPEIDATVCYIVNNLSKKWKKVLFQIITSTKLWKMLKSANYSTVVRKLIMSLHKTPENIYDYICDCLTC